MDQGTGENAGEYVAGAVELPVHAAGLHRFCAAGGGVKAHGAGEVGSGGGAGEHHGTAATQAQPLHDLPAAVLPGGEGGIGDAQQQGGLRQVGGDDIRLLRKAGHAGAHGGRVGLIDITVVAHDRVHHHDAVRRAEIPDKIFHDADLPFAAQKAAVNGLEAEPQGFPVGGNFGHFVCHIQKGEVLKSAGVGGEERGGQGAALDAHGGENGNGHCQRAAAEAGHVMDRGDARS